MGWGFILFYSLNKDKFIYLENEILLNFLKISFASLLMCFFLYFGLDYFEDKFINTSKFKLIYLLIVVGLSAIIYLFVAKILGILNLKVIKLNDQSF